MASQLSHEIAQAHQQEGPPAYTGDKTAAIQHYPSPAAQPQHQYSQTSQHGAQPQQQQMNYPQPGQPPGPVMVTPLDCLGEFAQEVDCPNCRRVTRSRFEDHASGLTLVMVIVLALFCLLLFWIPLAAKFAYDREWYCTNCNYRLAYQLHDAPVIVPHLTQQAYAAATGPNHPAYGQQQQYQHGQQEQQQQQQQQGQMQGQTQPQNYEMRQHNQQQQQQQQQGQFQPKQ